MPLGGDGNVEYPLVVEQGDRFASLRVWRALHGGRQVIYPQGMAYAEQVFWAGVRYNEGSEVPALPNAQELPALLRVPDSSSITSNLKKLLAH
jgi:hypothetical protein